MPSNGMALSATMSNTGCSNLLITAYPLALGCGGTPKRFCFPYISNRMDIYMSTNASKTGHHDESTDVRATEQVVRQQHLTSAWDGQSFPIQKIIPISEGSKDAAHKSTLNKGLNRGSEVQLSIATILIVGIASLVGAPLAGQAACNTYYVSNSGSDSNPGTITSPWLTLNKATGKAVACDTVYVRGGTYVENINIKSSGTASAPITIAAYPGELPVIDGQGKYPEMDWTPLVKLTGNYIVMSGFEVKNTSNFNASGVILYGHHNHVSNFNVHHIHQNGIYIQGDFGIVENSSVWQASRVNVNGRSTRWGAGLSAARDPADGITDNAVMRGNIVYNNWGEGLSTFEANGTVIDNNVVYDNWAPNIYLSDARNVILKNNLVYSTSNNAVNKNSALLAMSDEVSKKPRSTNNTVINNMFMRGNIAAFTWTGVPGSGLVNALIANNTIVNGAILTGPIMQGSSIQNNIFFRNDIDYPALISSRNGLSLRNNLWSSTPPLNASGVGDITGNPKLSLTGSTAAGQLVKNYFDIPQNSPVIKKGSPILKVTDRYRIISEGEHLNIGAYTVSPPFQFVASP